MYSPLWTAESDWIERTDRRSPNPLTVSPVGDGARGRDWKAQRMAKGESPFSTEHWTETKSPTLSASSSPNVNGAICGATTIHNDTQLFSYKIRIN